jgi:hypothetical protein
VALETFLCGLSHDLGIREGQKFCATEETIAKNFNETIKILVDVGRKQHRVIAQRCTVPLFRPYEILQNNAKITVVLIT